MAIRLGVVGVGFGSLVQIPGFQSEGVEVVAVCARREERAKEAAATFDIPNVFTDYHELVAFNHLDAVSVVTPIPLHHPVTIAALEAGKHVLCEKPFALNTAEAKEMRDLAVRSGKTAMVAHEFRWASARRRVRELIEEGYIGDLRMALVRLLRSDAATPPTRFRPDRDLNVHGGGQLFSSGSHYVDCLRDWFGEVETVSGELLSYVPERGSGESAVVVDVDDTFLATLHFASGGIAHVTNSRALPFGDDSTIEIYGSQGTLVTPQRGTNPGNPSAHGELFGARLGQGEIAALEIPERLEPFIDDRDDRLMCFRLLVREFLAGIEVGSSPSPNFDDGLRCQQILQAISESSRTGRRIAILQSA